MTGLLEPALRRLEAFSAEEQDASRISSKLWTTKTAAIWRVKPWKNTVAVKLVRDLPAPVRSSAPRANRLFRENPYSARVGIGDRALGALDGDAIRWFRSHIIVLAAPTAQTRSQPS